MAGVVATRATRLGDGARPRRGRGAAAGGGTRGQRPAGCLSGSSASTLKAAALTLEVGGGIAWPQWSRHERIRSGGSRDGIREWVGGGRGGQGMG
jgi:hypothetical protein